MNEIARFAAELTAQARRDEAAAFDRQYELARRAERAVAALAADGQARGRQWAEDDRRDDVDRRFDPEPDYAESHDADPNRAGPALRAMAPARRAAPTTAQRDADDDEEDEPTTWLR